MKLENPLERYRKAVRGSEVAAFRERAEIGEVIVVGKELVVIELEITREEFLAQVEENRQAEGRGVSGVATFDGDTTTLQNSYAPGDHYKYFYRTRVEPATGEK